MGRGWVGAKAEQQRPEADSDFLFNSIQVGREPLGIEGGGSPSPQGRDSLCPELSVEEAPGRCDSFPASGHSLPSSPHSCSPMPS